MQKKFDFRTSIKHLQIDKVNTRILVASATTVAIVVFCLVAGYSLIKQMNYQNKVIGLRGDASKQLEANIASTETLVKSYEAFEGANESIIGTPDKNSVIVLDALPSKYDFPALATSLDELIVGAGAKVTSITGTDNEATAEQDSIIPQPIEIPFEFNAAGSLSVLQQLVKDMERSIRPFQMTSLAISGDSNNLHMDVSAKTYYQPEKRLDIQQSVVSGSGDLTKNSNQRSN